MCIRDRIQRGLMAAVRACPDIDIKENHFAVEIITQHHLGARVTRRTPYINCYGAYVLNPETEKVDTYPVSYTHLDVYKRQAQP